MVLIFQDTVKAPKNNFTDFLLPNHSGCFFRYLVFWQKKGLDFFYIWYHNSFCHTTYGHEEQQEGLKVR